MRRLLPFLLASLLPALAWSQHSEQDLPGDDTLRSNGKLYTIMKRGEVEGRFRQYTMLTINDGAASDYHAIAFGGALGFSSQRWHGARFRISGGYVFDLSTADLTQPDAITGQPNRYEIGLYDVSDPRSRNDIAYLQAFHIEWRSGHERTQVVIGRQELSTPFLNPQDGRMQPTLFEGVWARHRFSKGPALEGGWLFGASPRGTSGWFSVTESMSLYPRGRDIHGMPSAYGDPRSAGILVLSARQKLGRRSTLTASNTHVENIFNTAMLQVEHSVREDRWGFGAMAVRQDAAVRQGSAFDAGAYMPPSESSWSFSAQVRRATGRLRWQLNYTRITADGRFLMPREWGREPFYTFLPRERNEGAGDVHAGTLNLIWEDARNGWRLQADGGLYRMPELNDARLSKYAMPSYMQFDINAQYRFLGAWKGLAMQLLVLAKLPAVDDTLTEKQSINKVDMLHADFIVNYIF